MRVRSSWARLRSYVRGLRRPSGVEADTVEEFRLHVELRTRDLERSGLSPDEAARRARVEFGHVDTHREQVLEARGLSILDQMRFSRLDVKLGLRMLAKYPGLSAVSVIGMTVAIAIAAGGFAAVEALMRTRLPLPEGDRIVALQNSDLDHVELNAAPHAAHDFLRWRRELKSVQDLTAFNTQTRNLVLGETSTELVRLAHMTASGFRVARVAPVLGRPLLDDDEVAGAPPVVVISYEEWQRHFQGDESIIGRQIRLGTVLHTVVGVMPKQFRFPVNHQYWTALQLDAAGYEPGQGPPITMFGRLAPGYSIAEAQAELSTFGQRASAEWPDTHGRLRAQVLPYTYPYSDINSPGRALMLHAVKVAIALLLVVVAVNVSVLVYARTATRLGEISIRSALGASRRRVVTQLFVEAAVLSGTAAVLGLGIAAIVLDRLNDVIQGPALPFWVRYRLSLPLVLYVATLALLAGVIVGVLPALKVTGRRVQAALQQFTARGSQIQLGRMWTAMIVLQVAVAVAALPYAIYVAGASLRQGTAAERYPAEEIVRAYLEMEDSDESARSGDTAQDQARLLAGARAFMQQLESEPDIAGVAFARSFPGYEWNADVDVEGGAQIEAQHNDFAVDLLPLFDQHVLAGRAFTPTDELPGANTVIINEAFARAIAAAPEHALGRRIRIAAAAEENGVGPPPNPWLEIVGVVPDFTETEGLEAKPDPLFYRPLSLENAVAANYVMLAIRFRGEPGEGVARELRQLAVATDPGLQVGSVETAARMRAESKQILRFMGISVFVLTLSVLLLSSAGIYAMMSFTVARRRREIGIRAALGAGARQVLTGIFARAGAQLGAGVLGGLAVALAIDQAAGGDIVARRVFLLPLVAVIMTAVGLLAALGPARRGLAVQPTEALRGD